MRYLKRSRTPALARNVALLLSWAEIVRPTFPYTDISGRTATLNPPLPFFTRPLIEALNLATVGMLPPRLREELDLPWSPSRERLLDASRSLVRHVLPLVPSMLREFPPARNARRRAAA